MRVAAFDFDLTLTFKESQLYFLLFAFPPFLYPLHWFRAGISTVLFFLKMSSREAYKQSLARLFFRGMDIKVLEKLGTRFAQTKITNILNNKAIERFLWHRNAGDMTILISASYTFYLAPWAQQMGFSHCIATELHHENGICTGELLGGNCWGKEKASRLQALFAPLASWDSVELWAYGDSDGDKELLALAQKPFYRCFE